MVPRRPPRPLLLDCPAGWRVPGYRPALVDCLSRARLQAVGRGKYRDPAGLALARLTGGDADPQPLAWSARLYTLL